MSVYIVILKIFLFFNYQTLTRVFHTGEMGEVPAPAKCLLIPQPWNWFWLQSLLPYHFYFSFILFVHTGHANFNLNRCSVFTECHFQLWKVSNAQNHFSSGSQHPIKKVLLAKYSLWHYLENPAPTAYTR